ncbi:MAG: ABC transporter substrate-binding protein [Myxococcota bacterium]
MKTPTFRVLALAFALLAPAVAHAEGGPGAIDAFRSLDGVISLSGDSDDRPDRDLQLRVDAMFDADWFAVQALGGTKHFAARCGKRCDAFTARMTRLVRANYLQHVRARQGGTVRYVSETIGKENTVVHTKVTFPKSTTNTKQAARAVAVDYVMHKVAGKWRVREIKTNGVGLGQAYRAQLTKLYAAGGIDAVFTKIDKTLTQLEG